MASIHAENLSRHDDAFVAVVVDPPDHAAATALADLVLREMRRPRLQRARSSASMLLVSTLACNNRRCTPCDDQSRIITDTCARSCYKRPFS